MRSDFYSLPWAAQQAIRRGERAARSAARQAQSADDLHTALLAKEAEIARLREALEQIAEGDWHRTCEPPYEIDGSNRKVSGEWAKLARAALEGRA